MTACGTRSVLDVAREMQEQYGAVGRCQGHRFRGDDAVGTGVVLQDHRLALANGKLLGQRARHAAAPPAHGIRQGDHDGLDVEAGGHGGRRLYACPCCGEQRPTIQHLGLLRGLVRSL